MDSKLPGKEYLEELLEDLSGSLENSPGMLLSILSNLKINSKNKFDRISQQLNLDRTLNFKSVDLQKRITNLELFHLHNGSQDVFIEFLIKHKSLLQKPLESVTFDRDENDSETVIVIINSQGSPFIKIHTGAQLSQLIKFLFENYIGLPIDQLVKSLKVPSLIELNNIYEELSEQKELSSFLNELVVRRINNLITKQVISH